MNWYCTYADELSVWLGPQQIIGAATIIQNSCLLIRDVIEKVHDFCINFFSLNESTTRDRAEQAIRSVKRACAHDTDLTQQDEFGIRDQIEPNIVRRIAFILIGCIRLTPILGSIYSLYVVSERPSY